MILQARHLLLFTLILFITSCSSRARLEKKDKKTSIYELSQTYSNLNQDTYCGPKPIVRFINFTYNKTDSLRITIDITTSLSENKIKGDLTLILDEYEIEYANEPISKHYTETLEIESQSRYPRQFRSRQSLANIVFSSARRKVVSRDSQKQYWNTVSVTIEPEDESMILSSADIFFSIKTTKCELIIYPSYDQIKELKRFLL